MSWTSFTIDGQVNCCRHLQTKTIEREIDGNAVQLTISYHNHCFTDEKGNGPLLFKREGRYWSQDRYDASLSLPNIIENEMLQGYAIPYYQGNNEQYHYMEASDYAIFFNVNVPENTERQLKIKVISAYELDQWGRGTTPKGKPKRVSWILSQRLQGNRVLKQRKSGDYGYKKSA